MGQSVLHRIFVVLSILWAAALPLRLVYVLIKYGGGLPEMIGYSLGVAVFSLPWLIILIPLLIVAHYTKPNRN